MNATFNKNSLHAVVPSSRSQSSLGRSARSSPQSARPLLVEQKASGRCACASAARCQRPCPRVPVAWPCRPRRSSPSPDVPRVLRLCSLASHRDSANAEACLRVGTSIERPIAYLLRTLSLASDATDSFLCSSLFKAKSATACLAVASDLFASLWSVPTMWR